MSVGTCERSSRQRSGRCWQPATSAGKGPLASPGEPEDARGNAGRSGEIIVVDNASGDGTCSELSQQFPGVLFLCNDRNLGFTAGNNQGLEHARGRYVLFLNPDTVVHAGALAAMLDEMELHPEIGVLGPRLIYGDGSPQPSCRRFPTLASALFESTPAAWRWPGNRWARRYQMADADPHQRQAVDWLVGAALLVRHAVVDGIGGFDTGYFMYSEELDLCRRARAAGWEVVYLPSAQVTHYEGSSSDQIKPERHIYFNTSKVRYFRKYHGPFVAQFLRLYLLASFAFEMLWEAAKWLLGSRRVLRRQRIAAYWRLLASGLQAPS